MVRGGRIARSKILLTAASPALLLLLAIPQLLPSSAATGDWPLVRFDQGNTSDNPNETVISAATVNTIEHAWSFNTNICTGVGSPVVAGGCVYNPCEPQAHSARELAVRNGRDG